MTAYCQLDSYQLYYNGELVSTLPPSQSLKVAYKELGMNYPKYHKMDDLSKLGVLGVELLLSEKSYETWKDDEVGIFFLTTHGCLNTDIKHQEAIEQKTVSPAVFVYTLANIVVGEISIKYKWLGESIVFVNDAPKTRNLVNHSLGMFKDGNVNKAIVGYLDSYKDTHKFRLVLVELANDLTPFDATQFEQIFK